MENHIVIEYLILPSQNYRHIWYKQNKIVELLKPTIKIGKKHIR